MTNNEIVELVNAVAKGEKWQFFWKEKWNDPCVCSVDTMLSHYYKDGDKIRLKPAQKMRNLRVNELPALCQLSIKDSDRGIVWNVITFGPNWVRVMQAHGLHDISESDLPLYEYRDGSNPAKGWSSFQVVEEESK